MTPAELRALIDARTDKEFAEARAAGDAQRMADLLSVGRVRHVSRLVTERGVISALGPVAGEAALVALEAFASATLPDAHPLKAMHPGIRRTLSWLKPPADGIDIGDPLTRQLLATFGALGVLTPEAVAGLLKLSEVADPVSPGAVGEALK